MCEVAYDGYRDDPLYKRDKTCLFGELINGYVPTHPHKEAGSGVFWTIDRPEGLPNPHPYGWLCQEHHEQLLLYLLTEPIVYDMTCTPKDRGKYPEYVAKGGASGLWTANLEP